MGLAEPLTAASPTRATSAAETATTRNATEMGKCVLVIGERIPISDAGEGWQPGPTPSQAPPDRGRCNHLGARPAGTEVRPSVRCVAGRRTRTSATRSGSRSACSQWCRSSTERRWPGARRPRRRRDRRAGRPTRPAPRARSRGRPHRRPRSPPAPWRGRLLVTLGERYEALGGQHRGRRPRLAVCQPRGLRQHRSSGRRVAPHREDAGELAAVHEISARSWRSRQSTNASRRSDSASSRRPATR